MRTHTELLELPSVLEELGVRTIALDGWTVAQGAYLWTDPETGAQGYDLPPSGYMVHHSASTIAKPEVMDSRGRWSKANAWAGLDRGDGRLYHSGHGAPTIVLTSAGPARTSSGYGYSPAAWEYTFKDRRAPWKAQGPDTDVALNRYVFNIETVHPGRGAEIDRGVLEAVVGVGVALHAMFDWNERTLGHNSWTQRKPDPEWVAGLPHDGAQAIIDVQDLIASQGGPTMYAAYVRGLVTSWASSPEAIDKTTRELERLEAEGLLEGSVAYWVALLDTPEDPAWVSFVGQTTLASWHRPE